MINVFLIALAIVIGGVNIANVAIILVVLAVFVIWGMRIDCCVE